MKSSQPRLSEERRQRSEAFVEKHLADLFHRLPMLSGFTLRHDLEVLHRDRDYTHLARVASLRQRMPE